MYFMFHIFVQNQKYTPKNKVRIVTAASLFDGHDAAINIMRIYEALARGEERPEELRPLRGSRFT
jgi:hypothetical protein